MKLYEIDQQMEEMAEQLDGHNSCQYLTSPGRFTGVRRFSARTTAILVYAGISVKKGLNTVQNAGGRRKTCQTRRIYYLQKM